MRRQQDAGVVTDGKVTVLSGAEWLHALGPEDKRRGSKPLLGREVILPFAQ